MTTKNVLADRCKLPMAFWQAIERLGLQPAAVLLQASLPTTLHLNNTAFISTPQLFAIWHAIERLSEDAAFGIRMVRDTSSARHMMAFVTALYAADFREGLARIVRYKRLCSPDRLHVEEKNGKISITSIWPDGTGPEPHVSVEASFALVLELGRRGTGQHLVPVTVALRRSRQTSDLHAAFFGCPIRFAAPQDRMVLDTSSLDLPFLDHNPEMLQMFSPAMAAALREMEVAASFGEQVKAALRQAFAGGHADVASVARALGLSERTMQRRITEEGRTFRSLLDETRQQLGRQLLSDATIAVDEVAFLLGYQNSHSFHRAFKHREQVTPGQWRRMNVKECALTSA